MVRSIAASLLVALLCGCAGTGLNPASGSIDAGAMTAGATAKAAPLAELDNLDYSTGTITVFRISGSKASVATAFKPAGTPQGIAADSAGNVYFTTGSVIGNPCAACVEIYSNRGKLLNQLEAPKLAGLRHPAALTDIALDARDDIYVSDAGQQAVYFFPKVSVGWGKPKLVVTNSPDSASVLATPDRSTVFASGGCGFAAVLPYTRMPHGVYRAGNCFGIGTIALIGGACDDQLDVMTPVDGAPGLVSVSSPSGGRTFTIPHPQLASVSGTAFSGDGAVAYVTDHHRGTVYAFTRPAAGWLSPAQPKLAGTYTGFKHLDIIAVRP